MPESPKPLHIPSGRHEPPFGWSWSRLDDLCLGLFDCPHSTPTLTTAGPYVVRTQDILSGVFHAEEAAHVSPQTYEERIARAEPAPGDLVYSREGAYHGIAAEVPPNIQMCLGQRMVLIRPDPKLLDFRFLRCWLNSPLMAAYIRGYRDGSAAERLNLPTIRSLPVLVPPLPIQRVIGGVLGSLDDKIRANTRVMRLLEGRLAAIFTAEHFDEASVRQIRLDEIIDVNPARPKVQVGDAPYVDMARLSTTSALVPSPAYRQARSGARFINGDTVMARITPCLENGKVGYIDCLPSGQTGVGSTEFLVLCPKETFPPPFAYLLARSRRFADFAVRHMSGSSGRQRCPAEAVARYPIDRPTSDALVRLTNETAPAFALMRARLDESLVLAALRDVLLPRLLSGEVHVREATELVEETA